MIILDTNGLSDYYFCVRLDGRTYLRLSNPPSLRDSPSVKAPGA